MVSSEQFDEFKHEVEAFMAATQADIDALNAQGQELASQLGTLEADVATAASAFQEEISSLQSGLDVSALQATLEPLAAKVQEIDANVKALVPTPAAPAAETPAEPAPATDSSQLLKPVYTTSLPAAGINVTAWTVSGYETENDPSGSPQPLFYFNADTNGDVATGNGVDNGAWVQYTGAVQQVPAS